MTGGIFETDLLHSDALILSISGWMRINTTIFFCLGTNGLKFWANEDVEMMCLEARGVQTYFFIANVKLFVTQILMLMFIIWLMSNQRVFPYFEIVCEAQSRWKAEKET